MHLVIISCTPRTTAASNTDKIISAFREGFEGAGNTAEVYYLAQKSQWEHIRAAFNRNSSILFALPLFVENIPGIMLEFLETLAPKPDLPEQSKTKIAFLLQGGFAEASQLRCCESYLEQLPSHFNCEYNGTLLKGGMFAVGLVPEKSRQAMLAPFLDMGRVFAADQHFDKDKVTKFAKPEYFSKGFAWWFNLIIPLQKLMFKGISKKMGNTRSLSERPYLSHVEQ